jgi:hypothetical protein
MRTQFRLVCCAILAFGVLGPVSQPLFASDPSASSTAAGTPGKHRCLSLVAGFSKSWLFVMSERFCAGGTDDIFVRADWPKTSIANDWAKGFSITNVAGHKNGWFVVMNDHSPLKDQIYFGPGEFPKSAIDEQLKKGFLITSVAGFDNQWVVVMSKGTGISRQLYTGPGSFEKSLEWMKTPYSDGYRITALAGDNGNEKEQYVIVLSSDSGISEQAMSRSGEIPEAWIQQKCDEGYEISAATGYTRWIVVMSKGRNLGNQVWKTSEKIPGTWFAAQGMSGVLEKDDSQDME